MAQGLVTDTYMSNLADAIRAKLGTEDTYTPAEMANAILSIPTGSSLEIVSWSEGTDEQIVAMLEAAHNGDIDLQTDGGWAYGDVRSITVDAFTAGGKDHTQQTIDLMITSFDDYANCGCVMQFDFKDCLANALRIHSSNMSNYNSSEMNTSTLPALVNALPDWLKNNLITFSNKKLSLRSGDEILSIYSNASYGNKKQGHNGSECVYWTRAPYGNYAFYARYAWSNSFGEYMASEEKGVAPFGCL